MCQKSATSDGIRSFVLNNYAQVKAGNPDFPFIVREAAGAQACVTARYEYGVERRIYLQNATEAEVGQTVEQLVADAKNVNAAVGSRFWHMRVELTVSI